MPIPPRIYAIPKMAPARTLGERIDAFAKECEMAGVKILSKDEMTPGQRLIASESYDRYLDGLHPEHYCARHDMYRPCQWCD